MKTTAPTRSRPARPEKIESAAAGDAAVITALLAAADLPHDDIAPHLAHFIVWRERGAIVGVVGMEIHGDDALLRSLAVAPKHRGTGIGQALVRALTAGAKARGLRRFFLLTTTAAEFFVRMGFVRVNRAEAPPAVAASTQFQGLCPASAVCLTARIADLAP